MRTRAIIFVLAATALGCASGQEGPGPVLACIPKLSSLQLRLIEKWNESPDALRQYIYIRRQILQIDVFETMVWADSIVRARDRCLKKATAER